MGRSNIFHTHTWLSYTVSPSDYFAVQHDSPVSAIQHLIDEITCVVTGRHIHTIIIIITFLVNMKFATWFMVSYMGNGDVLAQFRG